MGNHQQQHQQQQSRPVVCVNCQKETQQEIPANDSNNGCGDAYNIVARCMDVNHGQVAPCQQEWKSFQSCREENERITRE
jgi:hypothetical protein